MSGAQRQNKSRKKKNHFPRFMVGLIFFVLVILFFFKHPMFNVSKIQVTGNEKLQTSEVIETSKIGNGSNIFSLSKKTVADRLYHLPYVKDVKIKKDFPDKVVIEVTERVCTAAYRIENDYYAIDNDGVLLYVSPEPIPDITIIGGAELNDPQLGDRTFDKIKSVGARDLIVQLVAEDILKDIYVVGLFDEEHVELEMYSGTMIEFGNLKEVKYKTSFLKEILQDVATKGLQVKTILMDQGSKPVIVVDN